MDYLSGTITFYNNQRGFGFITCPDGSQLFFHISNFAKGESPVLEGQVEFKIAPPVAVGKKPQATCVRYIKREPRATTLFDEAAAVLAGSDSTEVR